MSRIKDFLDSKTVKNNSETEDTVLTWRETLSYGMGRGAQGMSTSMMSSTNINYFMTNLLDISEKAVGHIRLWCGIWDAFNDPIMGILVDKTRTKDGQMRPYIRVAPAISAFFTVLLFIARISLPVWLRFAIAVVAMVGWDMSYTAFDIPMGALAFSMTGNSTERTKLYGVSSIMRAVLGAIPQGFVMIGLMVPYFKTTTAPLYMLSALAAGVGMILLSRPAYKNTRERAHHDSEEPTVSECFRLLIKNKPLFMLFLANMAFLLVTVNSSVTTFVAVDLLGNSSFQAPLQIAVAPAPFIAGVFVPMVVEKLGKKADFAKIYRSCCLIAAAMDGLFFAVCYKKLVYFDPINGRLEWYWVVIMMAFIALVAIPLEFKNLLGKEMEAETVDYVEYKTGRRAEGIMLSLMSFTGKLTNSVSSTIGLWTLSAAAYVSHNDALPAAQPFSARLALLMCITLIPMAGYLLMLIPMKFYGITRENHEQMLKEIKARRAKRGSAGEEATVCSPE